MPKDMAQNTTIFTRRESEARSYCRGMNAVFTRASGSEMFDEEGNRYIDFLAGAGIHQQCPAGEGPEIDAQHVARFFIP